MIHLHTGLNGNGKTLNTVAKLEKLRLEAKAAHERGEGELREVYYYGLKEVTLEWKELQDAEKWEDLPDGSYILIDEAQEVFPTRGSRDKPPQFIERLAKHRHKGFEIYLTTPNPMMLDTFVRRLVNDHVHFMRPLGMERANTFTWQKCINDPEDYHARKECATDQIKFPTEFYGTYKSASIHTHKRQLPKKQLVKIGVLVGILATCGYYVYSTLTASDPEPEQEVDQTEEKPESTLPWEQQQTSLANADHLEQITPAIAGIPYTAPMYDHLIRASVFPKISGCGEVVTTTKDGEQVNCWCNTQQGTRISGMDLNVCRSFVKNGWFDFTGQHTQTASSGKQSDPFSYAQEPAAR